MAIRARLTAPKAAPTEWPWHHAKTGSISSSLIFSGDRRMEAENFLASGYGVRAALEARRGAWQALKEAARIWQPSRLKGIQVDAQYGTPFLAATQVFDHRPVPRKWLSLDRTDSVSDRFVKAGTILLTCSGTVGRAMVSSESLSGFLVSHDLLRINAIDGDDGGWIYAWLRAPTVRQMMLAAQYGHIIKHLEVSHLESLPLLSLKPALKEEFRAPVARISELRDQAHQLVNEGEALVSKAFPFVGEGDDGSTGFAVAAADMFGRGRRLDANRHNPRATDADAAIRAGAKKVEPLSELVARAFIPGRFKHVYGEEGAPYLDSAQILEVAPDIEKRVLSLAGEKQHGYIVDRGCLLIPCSGQLHGIIGSVVLATEWHENKVLTNHILRIIPKDKPSVRIGYLQAILGHPVLGRPRVQRGAFGSSVPELDVSDIRTLAIPRLAAKDEEKIADCYEQAAVLRGEADQLEEQVSTMAEDHLQNFLSGDTRHVLPLQ